METDWFHQALERIGASQADLARQLRLAPSAVSRMLKGERQMKPLEVQQTAQFLGVSQEEILNRVVGAIVAQARSESPPARGRRGRPPNAAPRDPGGERIPILSAARGGGEQEMFLKDGPIGYTARPANLRAVREAYAIYMVGASMEPRYEAGWLLHVNPFKPPTRGRDVVVYMKNRAVLIKQFVSENDDVLVLRQLNPEQELRIPRAEIDERHLIVGTDQEG